MKVKRLTGILLLVLLIAITAGCGKDKTAKNGVSGNEGNNVAASDIPVDIVSEIAGSVSEPQAAPIMDEEQKKNYTVLLDGCSDQEAVYYLYDITGDASPELIVGNGNMSAYSYNQGAVLTIGTLNIQKAYLSEQYGLVAYCENDGNYELRQYQYDGERVIEKVLVSASNLADYESQASGYLEEADELRAYELIDRTLFE